MCGIEILGQFVVAVGVSVMSGGQSMRATSSSWSRAHVALAQALAENKS